MLLLLLLLYVLRCEKAKKHTMTNTMQAVVFHAPGDVRVERVPVPECGDAEMLVQVDACAVCGSDLKSSKVGNQIGRAHV